MPVKKLHCLVLENTQLDERAGTKRQAGRKGVCGGGGACPYPVGAFIPSSGYPGRLDDD